MNYIPILSEGFKAILKDKNLTPEEFSKNSKINIDDIMKLINSDDSISCDSIHNIFTMLSKENK